MGLFAKGASEVIVRVGHSAEAMSTGQVRDRPARPFCVEQDENVCMSCF